jgi:hypothetical protein
MTLVHSVKDQVDEMFIALNGYVSVPPELHNIRNANYAIFDNSMGDSAKFYHAIDLQNTYYLALDDDLKVPRGYVDYLCDGVDRYNALCSLHGRIYTPPVTNFKRWTGNYRCLNTVNEDVKVNFIGSGVCCFNTNRLKVDIKGFKRPNMSDVWLSKAAHEQGVPLMVLKHSIGYLQYLHPSGSTIWQDTKDYSFHIQIMREFLK